MSSNTIILSSDTLSERTVATPEELLGTPVQPSAGQLRHRPRFAFRRQVLATPVRPDGGPDWANRLAGRTTDIGLDGIGLEFPRSINLETLGLILNVASDNGQVSGCLGVEIGNPRTLDDTTCHVGAQFTGFAYDLLKPENLTPRLNGRNWQYELAYSESILDQWAKIGVLETVLWDRVQLCPRCQGLPTFRRGCQACGSIHLANDHLLHHFACAHVGLVAEFENKGQLVCPKCRTAKLVIGTDYENMTGPFRCQDCQWSGTELEQVAQCLRCQLRFPVNQSYEQELKGYRAHRLDPLALLPSLGPTPALSVGFAADRCTPVCVH